MKPSHFLILLISGTMNRMMMPTNMVIYKIVLMYIMPITFLQVYNRKNHTEGLKDWSDKKFKHTWT